MPWPTIAKCAPIWGRGTLRRHPVGPFVGLFTVTDGWCPWSAARVAELGLDRPYDALSSRVVEPSGDGNLWLAPYAAMWLVEHP